MRSSLTVTATIDNRIAGDPSTVDRCGLVRGGSVLSEVSQPVTLRGTEMPGEERQLVTAQPTSVRTGSWPGRPHPPPR